MPHFAVTPISEIAMAEQPTPFKVGDVVQLNSGSYPMTVVQIGTATHRNHLMCVWTDRQGMAIYDRAFPPEALEPATKPLKFT
jgi:uncharacterized protein YodC (DUF2158 family)